MIKLGSDVNMRSRHEEKVSNMCGSSLINWHNPNYGVMLSITLPLNADLSWQCHLLDLALKSIIAMTRKGFLWTRFCNSIQSF